MLKEGLRHVQAKKEFLPGWEHVAWLPHCSSPVNHFKNYSLIFNIENIFKISQSKLQFCIISW